MKNYKRIVLIAVLMAGGCGIVKYEKTKTVKYEMDIQDSCTIRGHRNGRGNK